jgi:predicted RND superfamily exporter protein
MYDGKIKNRIYGSLPIALENAAVMKRDIPIAAGFSMVLISVLLLFFFRSKINILLIFLPILFGSVFSLAVIAAGYGIFSAIALGTGSVLIGVTVDQGIHLINHLESGAGRKELLRDLSMPLLASAFTTAGAFLSLLAASTTGLKQMGVFSAISIGIAVIFSVIVLPHLLIKKENINIENNKSIIHKIASKDWHKNKVLIVFFVLILIVSSICISRISFDNDLNNLSYMSKELKQSTKQFLSLWKFGNRRTFVISEGNTQEESIELYTKVNAQLQQLKNDTKIEVYSSAGAFLIPETIQYQRIKKWNDFWSSKRVQNVYNYVIKYASEFMLRPELYKRYLDKVNSVTLLDYQILPEEIKKTLLSDWIKNVGNKWITLSVYKPDPGSREQVMSELHNSPGVTAISKKHFADELAALIFSDFSKLTKLSLLIVLLILVISFRSIIKGIICFIPIALCWVITLGIMGLFNIQFNLINIIVSIFLFGIGIDYAIFSMQGIIMDHFDPKGVFNSYKAAILLSGTTTLIGFGILIFTAHPALKTIGVNAVIGLCSVLFITFVITPLFLSYCLKVPLLKDYLNKK